MTDQPEFVFTAPPADTTAARADELVAILRDRGWMTRRQLESFGFEERELRQLAENDDRVLIFSGPGGKGYKVFDTVTVEEFSRGIAAWRSAVRKQARRISRYLRAWHALGRPQL